MYYLHNDSCVNKTWSRDKKGKFFKTRRQARVNLHGLMVTQQKTKIRYQLTNFIIIINYIMLILFS